MPNSIRDMFPIFLDSGDGYYTMERINGIPFSKLMLSEDLTVEHLCYIMDSIERIHGTPVLDNDSINIYQNYCHKLQERYKAFDYSKYEKSKEIYQLLYQKLEEYENNKLGQKCIIHGDTVLTNILLNQSGKIKFIDMCGKIGETLTLFGDKFYDWAKLYQSLFGYDEILENKQLSQNYKDSLLSYFENRIIYKHGSWVWHYLRYITASLLFTLIPLHNDSRCDKYFHLVLKLITN
jgi:serine/threonine protein kinase